MCSDGLKFCDLLLLRQQNADFRMLLGPLRINGILPSSGDIQLQTEDLASQVRFISTT